MFLSARPLQLLVSSQGRLLRLVFFGPFRSSSSTHRPVEAQPPELHIPSLGSPDLTVCVDLKRLHHSSPPSPMKRLHRTALQQFQFGVQIRPPSPSPTAVSPAQNFYWIFISKFRYFRPLLISVKAHWLQQVQTEFPH
ncbi:hypothetical protein Bca101_077898 [Brassica carinata]